MGGGASSSGRVHGAPSGGATSGQGGMAAAPPPVDTLRPSALPEDSVRIFENTTIVIADVVDPPDIINHYTGGARSLIVLLKRLFSSFNSLALEFGVRKIRAVSDSWVAISGLEDNIKSAENAVAMSNEMIKVADEMDIPIRIGIHTGPVTAGRLKPGAPFDIWGSSVKEAYLMLALCPPLRVNVSSITYECVYERFVFESREVCIGSECRYSYLLNMDLDEQDLPPSPTESYAQADRNRLVSLQAGHEQSHRSYIPRILVVEDNMVARKVIQRILERLGCHFELAKDGKEAIEVVSQRWPFDVVLMDIEMPVMNGWEATERIRFDFPEPVRSVPIVALTSHTTIDDARRCLEEGMDDFITKPVKEEVLKAVLEKWISDFAPKAILPAVRLAKPSQTPPPQPPPPPPTSATGGGIAGGSGSSSVETTGVNSMMHAPAESAADPTSRRVLVVDDNALVRKMIGRLLERLNCHVLFASTGMEAINILREQWPINAIFMDISMPDMDGYETTQAIRELDPPFRDVAVIAVTAYTTREHCDRYIDAGMDDFVTKPLRRDVLQDLLNKWIS